MISQRRHIALACVALSFAPGSVFAQVCFNSPSQADNLTLTGVFSTAYPGHTVGASVTTNVKDPIAFQTGYAMTIGGRAKDTNILHATVGYELPGVPLSVCPRLGIRYSSQPTFTMLINENLVREFTPATVNQLAMPVGLGVGHERTLQADLRLGAFAFPHVLLSRRQITVMTGDRDERASQRSTDVGAEFGIQVAYGRLYIGPSVVVTTDDRAPRTFTIAVGLLWSGAQN